MQASASWLPLARTVAIAAVTAAVWPGAARAQFRDSIPSQAFYVGVEQVYRGELRDAQRTFNRNLTGSVKTIHQGGTIRWIDSICYHAMLGETFYHWGQPEQALEQFNLACSLYLQYPRWMMRVQFEQQPVADVQLARVMAPWGASMRRSVPGRFATRHQRRAGPARQQPGGAAGRRPFKRRSSGQSTWSRCSAAPRWPFAAATKSSARSALTTLSRKTWS